jgi:hypothetical protein
MSFMKKNVLGINNTQAGITTLKAMQPVIYQTSVLGKGILRRSTGGRGRNDPNIVCTYE